MKPLRDLVLIQQKVTYKEEKTDSGLFIVSGESANYNFKTEHESAADIFQKKSPTQGEFIGKLIEFNRKKNGRYYNFHPGDTGNDLSLVEKNEKLKDIIFGRKGNTGEVVELGDRCKYFDKQDMVIFKKNSNYNYDTRSLGNDLVFVEEKDILVKKDGEKYFVHPEYIIIKISKESRDNVFKRKFKNDAGEEMVLFLPTPTEKLDANHSEYFVTCGEVYGVGAEVKNIFIGDIGIVNYQVDNDEEIIVGYEGEDKLIVIKPFTTRCEKEIVAYANRRSNRDQIVQSVGDYDELSQLIGIIRGEELIAIDPYIFLKHEETIVSKKTKSGIHYTEDEKIIKREILAISEESEKRTNLKKGQFVIMDDFDVFNATLEDRVVSCINDVDIMAPEWVID
jgi:co-chaperonin GroES (HSP10)